MEANVRSLRFFFDLLLYLRQKRSLIVWITITNYEFTIVKYFGSDDIVMLLVPGFKILQFRIFLAFVKNSGFFQLGWINGMLCI